MMLSAGFYVQRESRCTSTTQTQSSSQSTLHVKLKNLDFILSMMSCHQTILFRELMRYDLKLLRNHSDFKTLISCNMTNFLHLAVGRTQYPPMKYSCQRNLNVIKAPDLPTTGRKFGAYRNMFTL